MKLRMLSSVVNLAVATALVAGVATSAFAQAAPAQPGAAAATNPNYKIGVVDRKKIFDDYGKKKAAWDVMSQHKAQIEKDLNAKFDALKAKSDKYNTTRGTLSDEERSKQDSALNKEKLDLQSEYKLKQQEIADEGERIIKDLSKEIDAAVRALAQSGNYHLIFEADPAFSSVLYYSDSVDITGQVLEYINTHAGSSTAAAPAPKAEPAAADNGNKKRDKK